MWNACLRDQMMETPPWQRAKLKICSWRFRNGLSLHIIHVQYRFLWYTDQSIPETSFKYEYYYYYYCVTVTTEYLGFEKASSGGECIYMM